MSVVKVYQYDIQYSSISSEGRPGYILGLCLHFFFSMFGSAETPLHPGTLLDPAPAGRPRPSPEASNFYFSSFFRSWSILQISPLNSALWSSMSVTDMSVCSNSCSALAIFHFNLSQTMQQEYLIHQLIGLLQG